MKPRHNLKGLLLVGSLIALVGCSGESGSVTTINGDESPPVVISTMPADSSSNIAVNSVLSMTFNEAIDTTSVSDASVVLSSSEGNISGTISASVNSVTFTPQSALSFNLLYTVTLKSGTKDLAGNVLDADHSWNFTTGDAADNTPPSVVDVTPPDGSNGLGVNSIITVEFNEAMDPATLNSVTLRLSDGLSTLAGTVTATGQGAAFTPSAPLEQNVLYVAKVTTGASDLAGNALAADYTWSFTTEGDVDITPPSVVLTDPQNGHEVSYSTTRLSAVFSEEMNASTVSGSTFTLANNKGEVNGTVNYANGTATFDAAEGRLDLLASYTATITSYVKDSAGIRMAADHIWHFVTQDGSWKSPQFIADDTGAPQVAMNNDGTAVMVWYQSDGTRYNIWANRYDAASGSWGTAELIENNDAGAAYSPQVAVDGNGNAVAVWYQFDGTWYSIYSNRYDAASGSWGTAELIENNDAGTAYSPQVAVDESGNAVAVWQQSDGTSYNIYSNRYDKTSGSWGTVKGVEYNSGTAQQPKLSMDSSGNAIAVWFQSDGTRNNIYANYLNSTTGNWTGARLIESDDTGGAEYPEVAMDSSGNAVAVWHQWDGTRWNIWSNRYVNGSWITATLLESDTGNAQYPQVAVDSNGNAMTVWQQYDGIQYSIWAKRFNNKYTYWESSRLIESENAGAAYHPQVALDGNGNAIAVWYMYDGSRYKIFTNRYNSTSGQWGTAYALENENIPSATNPQISMDGNGNAIAAWSVYDGIYHLWSNRFE